MCWVRAYQFLLSGCTLGFRRESSIRTSRGSRRIIQKWFIHGSSSTIELTSGDFCLNFLYSKDSSELDEWSRLGVDSFGLSSILDVSNFCLKNLSSDICLNLYQISKLVFYGCLWVSYEPLDTKFHLRFSNWKLFSKVFHRAVSSTVIHSTSPSMYNLDDLKSNDLHSIYINIY